MYNLEKLKVYGDLLIHIKEVKSCLYGEKAYLNLSGWRNSIYEKKVIDRNEQGLPWCTYSFIHFIEPRLKKDFRIFEYGSGASTEWYAQRCKEVISVENNEEWYLWSKKKLEFLDNVNVLLRTDQESYCKAIGEKKQKYDLVIVDGIIGRNESIKEIIEGSWLTGGGVIVLDDAERKEYQEGIELLTNAGFKRLDFSGLAPSISYYGKLTTIFYRENNILNI